MLNHEVSLCRTGMRSKSGTQDPATIWYLPERRMNKKTEGKNKCLPACYSRARWHLLVPVLCILVALLPGTVLAAANAQVSVSASPSTIQAGETSTITVVITRESVLSSSIIRSPLPGATVSLSTTSPGVQFSPASGTTDSQGTFTSTLLASTAASGNVPVHAVAQLSNDFYGEGATTITVQRPAPLETSRTTAVNQPPVAVIQVDRNAGETPFTVTFDGRGSYDPDGSVVGYQWTFGDGATGEGYVTTHQYSLPGTYMALLVVTDATGLLSLSSTVNIMVNPKGEPPEKQSPEYILVTFSPQNPTKSDPVTISVQYRKAVDKPCLDIFIDDALVSSCNALVCEAMIGQRETIYQYKVRYCNENGAILETSPVKITPTEHKLCLKSVDRDCDDVPDTKDNCPDVFNPDQKESDASTVRCTAPASDGSSPGVCTYSNGDGKGDACDTSPEFPNPQQLTCPWCNANVKPVLINGKTTDKMDIVFVASATSCNRNTGLPVSCTTYSAHYQTFRNVVIDNIRNGHMRLDAFSQDTLPTDFQNRFNYYIYWNSTSFGDAFPGMKCNKSCSGTFPSTFLKDAPYSDIGTMLYPPYYVGTPPLTEAGGCENGDGPPAALKAPGFYLPVMMHETGHGAFFLIDTYCGDTSYLQNNPDANVWSSLQNCKNDIKGRGTTWNEINCRQITWDDPMTPVNPDCSRSFWRYDPDPDLMRTCDVNTQFRAAGVRKINEMLGKLTK